MPEYIDYAEYYDYDTNLKEDIPFYLKYANRVGSPILEIGCGTGRLLFPLAEAGHFVHGIDLSEKMLAIAKHKLTRINNPEHISIIQANMIDFDLSEKSFKLAI